MPRGLPRRVRDNLEKCRSAALAAVDAYNRPGPRFRTAHYIVMITIAWTALFHALFYLRSRRPWYRKSSSGPGRGIRYVKIDGEPKHWDLAECIRQHFGGQTTPVRKNLEFLIGLRNKIEHRNLPQLDPSLYGECQASLLNLEEMLNSRFGPEYALSEQLGVSLQFSRVMPPEKRRAAKVLASSEARSVKEYIERFRGNLASTVLASMKYSFSVFLVPRLVNRKSAADVAVSFVHVNEASEEEIARLEKLNVLIKEKHIPIVNLDLRKPGQVVEELQRRVPHPITMTTHIRAWRRFGVRPASGDPHPERTQAEFCVYDPAHKDYLYTPAWTEKLVREMTEPRGYEAIASFRENDAQRRDQ